LSIVNYHYGISIHNYISTSTYIMKYNAVKELIKIICSLCYSTQITNNILFKLRYQIYKVLTLGLHIIIIFYRYHTHRIAHE